MTRPVHRVILASLLSACVVAWPSAQQPVEPVTVPLSDPARVAAVRIDIFTGDVAVRGENRKDILVTPRSRNDNDSDNRGRGGRRGRGGIASPDPSAAGLTRLTPSGGFTITETNNTVTIESGPIRPVDLDVRVPNRVNLRLSGVNGSQTIIENVEGDIEVKHLNGGIRATNVSGSVVAETTNGSVNVVLTRLTGDKAMAFTSFNGNVDVTLPATAKANLRMQTENGDIYTDFDVQTRGAAPQQRTGAAGRVIEVNRAILGTINGGGAEFELRTFNGNIYVRRGAQP